MVLMWAHNLLYISFYLCNHDTKIKEEISSGNLVTLLKCPSILGHYFIYRFIHEIQASC